MEGGMEKTGDPSWDKRTAQRQQDQEGTTAAVHKDEWAALSFGPGKIQALL